VKFEYKYIVPVSQLDELRTAISPFVDVDPYAAGSPAHEYTVRSVYFDTHQFDFYFEKVDGFKIRKKLRIRGYNDQKGDDIVFLEIKRKFKEPIEKNREKLDFETVKELLNESGFTRSNGDGLGITQGINGAARFLYHIYSQNLKPVVLVIYEREAYIDRFHQDMRLTIDKNLRSVPFPGIEDLFDESTAMPALEEKFIFEVKFHTNFPFWLRPVVGRLGLMRQAASKYVMCINNHRLADNISRTMFFSHSTGQPQNNT